MKEGSYSNYKYVTVDVQKNTKHIASVHEGNNTLKCGFCNYYILSKIKHSNTNFQDFLLHIVFERVFYSKGGNIYYYEQETSFDQYLTIN